MAKTWHEKLNSSHPAHVETMEKTMWGLPIGTKLFIAHPTMVKAYIEKIPLGKSKTVVEMRESLAKKNKADATCPMTASIFVRIVAEAALDEMRAGASVSKITPFWRIVDEKSTVAKKLSCGVEFISKQRKAEGISR